VLPILVSRKALPPETAEQLLEDSDSTVRYYALRSLVDGGKEISDDGAKAILIKPAARAGFGFLSASGPDKQGEEEWKLFLREGLRTANVTTLERRAANETVFDRDAHFALDFKQFGKRGAALRGMVDDRFQAEFAKECEKLEKRFGLDSETVRKIKALEEYLRKKWLREGLDVLCEKDSPEDLPRIRKALDEGVVEYSEIDVNYLKRHGEWRDIGLLISLFKRPIAGAPLLGASSNPQVMNAIAEAAYSIGRTRFAELLAHSMPEPLLSRILVHSSEKEFSSLKDDEILKYLSLPSDQIRRLVALKSIRSLTRKRLMRVFDAYMTRDQRYYNVVHWLDMGSSLSRSRATTAAGRALSRMD
jgi:hypothetical protein